MSSRVRGLALGYVRAARTHAWDADRAASFSSRRSLPHIELPPLLRPQQALPPLIATADYVFSPAAVPDPVRVAGYGEDVLPIDGAISEPVHHARDVVDCAGRCVRVRVRRLPWMVTMTPWLVPVPCLTKRAARTATIGCCVVVCRHRRHRHVHARTVTLR